MTVVGADVTADQRVSDSTTGGRAPKAKRPHRPLDHRQSSTAYLFILPALVIFAVFLAYPLLRNAYISLFSWNGLTQDIKFIGLSNYAWVFSTPAVLETARNTIVFAVVTITIQMGGGFLLACALAGPGILRRIGRTVFFIPVVLTPVVVGYLFSKILEPTNGDLANLLRAVGLPALIHPWLADPATALLAVSAVNIWLWIGFSMSVYQSALAGLPSELVEAARIDGANPFQVIRYVIFPYLRLTHYALLVLSVIGTLKTFDVVYILTGGGPSGSSDLPMTLLFRVGFQDYQQGRASALGTLLFLVALALTWIQLRRNSRKERAE